MLKIIFTCLALLVLVNCVTAKIHIDISNGQNSSDVKVQYSGAESQVVTENDVELFKISDSDLKKALKKHYDGKTPNNIYLKKPTPWGDLYKTYHWEEVTKVVTVKSARVKDFNKKQEMVLAQGFDNVFNNTIKVNAGISQTVENTISTTWSRNKEYTVSQEIEYDVNVIFAKVSGTTGISFSSSWGQSDEKSETLTIGATSAVEIELKPGQAATAVLTANRGTMEIEIVYQMQLRGNVAVNFKKAYKSHHFWGPTIQDVMKSGGIKNEKTVTQIIKVGVYIDASLVVYDKKSGQNIA